VVDRLFAEPELAALYDLFCAWDQRDDLEFYLPLVLTAGRVLDVGCGTGMLLRQARQEGHAGRLCGLDPAAAMLAVARTEPDVEWVRGDLATMAFDQEFDLVVMTGHAFQVLTGDGELRAALSAIARALAGNGRFAFETRHPLARTWERWIPANATEVTDPAGRVYRQSNQAWDRPRISHSTLRFLGADALAAALSVAGLTVEEQFGDWDRRPLTESSPEIITIARRTGS
jgi:SAM-dependent methyltransferase